MKSMKVLLWVFFYFFAVPFSSKASEKDIVREWIKEDMEEEAINCLEKLAAEKEKARVEATKGKIKELYAEAQRLTKLKKYDMAREKYEEILALNPRESKAEKYISRMDEKKRVSEARTSTKMFIPNKREKRKNFQRLSEEGAQLYYKKHYKEAREKWEEALRYDPDNVGLKVFINRARLQEIEEIKKEILFEKELEEAAAFNAIDEAYLPKRGKHKAEKAEEGIETKEEAAKRKFEEMLEKIEISELHLKDVDLRKVVNEISSRTKVTILVDWTAISEAASSGITTMHLDLDMYNPMPLKSFLDYLMKLTRLKYRVETHTVLISTPEALEKEEMVVKVYKLKYGMTKLRPVTLKPLGPKKD